MAEGIGDLFKNAMKDESGGLMKDMFVNAVKDEQTDILAAHLKDLGKDEMKQMINILGKDGLKDIITGMGRDEFRELLPKMGTDAARDIFNKMGKDEIKDLFRNVTKDDFNQLFKGIEKDELRDMFRDAGSDFLKKYGMDEGKDVGKGFFREVGDEMKDGMKSFKPTQWLKYTVMGWFGYKTVMALNTQSADDCQKKCIAHENTDHPDSNCPSDKNEAECHLFCKTSGKGQCSEAQRKKNAEEECGGVNIVGCAGDNVSGFTKGALDFFSKYGDYIFTGIWIVLFFVGLSLLYKFVKMFTSTQYNKAQDWMQKAVCPKGKTLGPNGKRCVPIQ